MANLLDTTYLLGSNIAEAEPINKGRFTLVAEGIPAFIIKSTDMPSAESHEIELWHINTRRKVKGKTVWNNINIVLQDYIVPSSAQTIIEWLRLGHESITGRDGYKAMYKKNLDIYPLGPVGDKVRHWHIKNAWPVSINFGNFDWYSDEASEIEVTLAMDWAVLNY